MLKHATLEQLQQMKLHGMARAFEEQLQQPDLQELRFEERLGLLVEREATERESRRLTTRLRRAKLREQAAIEDIDFRARRGLDKRQILTLASCRWIADHLNVLITGKAGVGKTFLACALAHKACREGHTALYLRVPSWLMISPRTICRIWAASSPSRACPLTTIFPESGIK